MLQAAELNKRILIIEIHEPNKNVVEVVGVYEISSQVRTASLNRMAKGPIGSAFVGVYLLTMSGI